MCPDFEALTYVWFPVGPFEAAVCGVQRDVVSVGQMVVGAEASVAPPVAAAPQQLQRKNRTSLVTHRYLRCGGGARRGTPDLLDRARRVLSPGVYAKLG